MKPTIVITGVSSGIGYDALRYLSQHGYFVFGSVRSGDAKAGLESEFPENFKALVFDITDPPAIQELHSESPNTSEIVVLRHSSTTPESLKAGRWNSWKTIASNTRSKSI